MFFCYIIFIVVYILFDLFLLHRANKQVKELTEENKFLREKMKNYID